MLLLASVLRNYTITSACRFTCVHTCVKERGFEHFERRFLSVAEKRATALPKVVLDGDRKSVV